MRLLRLKQVEQQIDISGTHIRRMEKAGQFPARVQISERTYGYSEDEVNAWIRRRLAARKSQAA